MAEIFIICGKYDEAIDELEIALATETIPNAKMIKLFYSQTPIRDNPKFIALLEKYQ